jgi:fused signal recognition particle receptor
VLILFVGKPRGEARRLAEAAIAELGLREWRDHLAGVLPYGDERRVEVARALAMSPDFLLLDEPAAGLNEGESDRLLRVLAPIPKSRNLGMLIVDHDMHLIMRLCHRIHVLNYGHTIGEGAPEEVRRALAEDIARILEPVAAPLVLDAARKPHVVLVVGVNGSGKTTTIAKLASLYKAQGLKALLAAGDTFRAAAIDQLEVWGERSGCAVVAKAPGADAAGLAYEALETARREACDLLLIDTAGRLHNKADLMAELQKIVRVLKKLDGQAPHDVLLVLDATTGQNAHAQVETFKALAGVTGLALTKLDGSARGGVLVALAERFALPVHAVGVGEGLDDLRPFEARDFANSLLGIEA